MSNGIFRMRRLIFLRLGFAPFLKFRFSDLDLFRIKTVMRLNLPDNFFGTTDIAAILAMSFGQFKFQFKIIRLFFGFSLQNFNSRAQIAIRQ